MPPVLGGRLSTALESKRSSMEGYRTFQSDKSSDFYFREQVSHTLWFVEVAALRTQSHFEAAVLLTEESLRIDWDSEIMSLEALV